jgi:putative membrane protein
VQARPLDRDRLEQDLDAVGPFDAASVPILRTLIAGTLMGTANLVPGVSGGTMVLAAGLYAHFVHATADLTRLRFGRRAVLFIVLLFGAKFAAMGLLGVPLSETVVRYRTIAYAAFLGMTLAGTPVLWRVLRKPEAAGRKLPWALVPVGIGLMALLSLVPTQKVEPDEAYVPAIDVPLDLAAGAAAYSAMVLPGVSGGTIKLAMGRYEPTVWSIGQTGNFFNPAVEAAPPGQWLPILLPYVGGAIVGLVLVSNALKWLLRSYELPVTGLLLGILWGSVLPIWPYDGNTSGGQLAWSIPAAGLGFTLVYALTRWKSQQKPDPANDGS